MFEVGKTYRISMWEPGEDGGDITTYYNCEVVRVEGPLIKIRQTNKEQIINTGSHAFVRAEVD